jgi:hypothetical protein
MGPFGLRNLIEVVTFEDCPTRIRGVQESYSVCPVCELRQLTPVLEIGPTNQVFQ